MDLFGDLPEPGADSTVTHTTNETEIFIEHEKQNLKRKLDENSSLSVKKVQHALYELQGFSAKRKGEREEMQDYHVVINSYGKDIPQLRSSVSRLSFYAVFDGHGGTRAAKFAATHLHQNLASALLKVDPDQIERDIKKAILEAFKKTDEDFLKLARASKPSWKDGTTAIVILALDNVLYISNIGDSKAVLCRYNKENQKPSAISLSKDHNPTDYGERMRIQKAGGFVRDGRVMGVLEVSRSIGDGQYKTLGVTCVPDVKRCQLTSDDNFIILACDGLWKVFTSDDVTRIVLGTIKKKTDGKNTDVCFETACSRLVNEAIRKQSGDNVTVVLISVKEISP